MNRGYYLADLAYIHDAGFMAFAAKASVGVVRSLRLSGIWDGRVVELGCGSGGLTRILVAHGYDVHGVDHSRSMIQLARKNVPRAHLSVGSLWDYEIPPCNAVVSVGECLNYEFEESITSTKLSALFRRIASALPRRGVFMFDVLCETPREHPKRTMTWTQGKDWLVAVERSESRSSLTRHIVSFRQVRKSFRRSIEVHRLRKHRLILVMRLLLRNGFAVKVEPGYVRGEPLGEDHPVIFATRR